jgi:light-regulated signal transduction histidine kinase (bacteriophytochrome)
MTEKQTHCLADIKPLVCCAKERACHKRQTQLEALAKELKRSNDALEAFASMASHDLKEPLCTITSFLKLIELRSSASLPAESREHLKFALSASDRLRNLIQDLLDFSRIGMKEVNQVDFDMREAVDRAMNNLGDTVSENFPRLFVDELPRIHADLERTIQLFQNLISNAIKYRSHPAPLIRIKAKHFPDEWLIEVADDGIGIEKQFHGRIFEMFRRLHGQEIPGSGVGLGICRKIVEQRGGKIWVESELGKGSRFYFTIPHNQRSNNEQCQFNQTLHDQIPTHDRRGYCALQSDRNDARVLH